VAPNTSRDGYGLGLSIVERIARLLDFKVSVTSEPGRGSAFAFNLPASSLRPQDTAAASESAAHPRAPTDGMEILLVEDEAGVRNAMRMLLELEGYSVTATATAEEALARLRAGEHFDLLITDYHLEPGRTGTEVIAAARALHGESFKAILVTGDTSSAVRELRGDEALRITSKPINSDELLELARSLVSG
jgi:CheY-like chemotaxis protein